MRRRPLPQQGGGSGAFGGDDNGARREALTAGGLDAGVVDAGDPAVPPNGLSRQGRGELRRDGPIPAAGTALSPRANIRNVNSNMRLEVASSESKSTPPKIPASSDPPPSPAPNWVRLRLAATRSPSF
ncbi:MAG: hypothetical protein RLZZ221_398, partial [Verrucomicrobiota bacterium]